jgi:hypothetical protein
MGKSTKLAAEQLRALDRLKAVRGIERFYLAGGTAETASERRAFERIRSSRRPTRQ